MAFIDTEKMIKWMLHACTERSRGMTTEKQ